MKISADASSTPSTKDSHPTTMAHRKKVILVIIDHEEVREVVVLWLGGMGNYRVLAATDGLTSIPIATRETPDLILMDLCVAHRNDFDVIRKIKACPAIAHVPIVTISDRYWNAAATDQALRLGCVDSLDKGSILDKIEAVIKRHLP